MHVLPPQVGIYFPLYDALAAELAQGPAGPQAPLLAGAAARTAAVLCTSPLELVRTRMQARGVATSCCVFPVSVLPVQVVPMWLSPSIQSGSCCMSCWLSFT